MLFWDTTSATQAAVDMHKMPQVKTWACRMNIVYGSSHYTGLKQESVFIKIGYNKQPTKLFCNAQEDIQH